MNIGFYTNDHEPIHVHAVYGNVIVKVILYVRDNKVTRTVYQPLRGNLSPAKMKQLKDFISKHKEAILFAWEQVFNGNPVKKIVITKKI